jgi:hypothetical protein
MGALPFMQRDPLSRASKQLLSQAREIVGRELLVSDAIEYRIAVILAHAACDLQTEEAMNELIDLRDVDYLRDALVATRKVSLGDDRARRVYQALSGDSPWSLDGGVRRTAWWDAWVASADKRDLVAHRGEKVTLNQADASIAACEAYVDHLIRVVGELRMRHHLDLL